MLFSGLRALSNSYRSFIFSASNQVKFISGTSAHVQGITAGVTFNPCVHQFKLNATFIRHYCSESVTITFKLPDGTVLKRTGKVGQTIRQMIEEKDPDFEGYGCCGGSISCGGCHVVFSEEDYDKLSEPDISEADLLDKVHDLTLTWSLRKNLD